MKMKLVIFSFLFCLSPNFLRGVLAQSGSQPPAATGEASPIPSGCAQSNDKFDVKTDKTKHPMTRPESGKALMYLMQDDQNYGGFTQTVRWGLDGTWVGATRANSYFYFSIEPGQHHLCTDWTPSAFAADWWPAAYQFTASAGETYYFRVVDISLRENAKTEMKLAPVNSDEAQLLISRFAYSKSQKK